MINIKKRSPRSNKNNPFNTHNPIFKHFLPSKRQNITRGHEVQVVPRGCLHHPQIASETDPTSALFRTRPQHNEWTACMFPKNRGTPKLAVSPLVLKLMIEGGWSPVPICSHSNFATSQCLHSTSGTTWRSWRSADKWRCRRWSDNPLFLTVAVSFYGIIGVVERVYIKSIIFSGDAVHSFWFRVGIESVEAGSNLQVIFKSKEQT